MSTRVSNDFTSPYLSFPSYLSLASTFFWASSTVAFVTYFYAIHHACQVKVQMHALRNRAWFIQCNTTLHISIKQISSLGRRPKGS